MKVLVLYDYPPSPGGLATQGDLLYQGLKDLGLDVYPAHFESGPEKEWYFRWFKPDLAVGIGFWGHTPHLVLHPQKHGVRAVPWLVADGYIANYQDVLNSLPLILVTSQWVKDTYIRDGIDRQDNIEVLPVGCDTAAFVPRDRQDPKVAAIRQLVGVKPDELMILTIGGDATSKGGREVMEALGRIKDRVPPWKYICKVWPQPRTTAQNVHDLELARELGIADRVNFVTGRMSRNIMPYLTAACDIYAAPSRLEGFGMPQVEANACGKPVLAIRAMALLDTMVHGETALLADIGEEIRIDEATVGEDAGFEDGHLVHFPCPRVVDYRASVPSVAEHLERLMTDPALRARLGAAGRQRAVAHFDYQVVARKFLDIASRRLKLK